MGGLRPLWPPQRTSPRILQKIPPRIPQKMMALVSARSVDLSKAWVQILLVPPMMTARHCSKSGKGEGIATLLALPWGPPFSIPAQGLGEGLGGVGWVVLSLRPSVPQVGHSGELLRPELLHQRF